MKATQSNMILDVKGIAGPDIIARSKGCSEWDMKSLINFIRKSNSDTKENIIGIYDLAQQVYAKHGYRQPQLSKFMAGLFLFFDDLLFHLKKEEQILFPNIIQLMKKEAPAAGATYSTFGLIKECTLALQNEHQAAIRELIFFRQLTADYDVPADASQYYKQLFQRMNEFEKGWMFHVYLQDHVLFPMAIQLDDETFSGRKEE